MTTLTNTLLCAKCLRHRNPAELKESIDGGLLFCKDALDCKTSTEKQGKAYLNVLLIEKERLEVRRGELIQLIAQARHEYNLPDPAQVENDRWLAELKAESGNL